MLRQCSCFCVVGRPAWRSKEDTVAGLVEAVCINDQKVCCAEDRYGKSCKKCPGRTSEGTVCSGHGTCGGAGTRKGNGKCTCTSLGHEGKACEKCKTNWFKLPDAHSEATCEKCDVACNECTGSGPGHCVEVRWGPDLRRNGCHPVAPVLTLAIGTTLAVRQGV